MSKARRGVEDHALGKTLALRALARIATVTFLLAAATIHASQIPLHLREWDVAGWFFIAAAVVQVALAAALARSVNWRARDTKGLIRSFSELPQRSVSLTVAATSLGLVAVWAISRTTGVPFGPEAGVPEAVTRPDFLATMFELLTLVALAPLVPRHSTRRTAWVPRRKHTVVMAALILSSIATTAAAVQPVTCGEADLGSRELTKKEQAGRVLLEALGSHGSSGAHSEEPDSHDELGAAQHEESHQAPADACH